MNDKCTTWDRVDKRWTWMQPNGDWLREVFPKVQLRAVQEELRADEVIQLVRKELEDRAARRLRYRKSAQQLAGDAAQFILEQVSERNTLVRWNPERGTRLQFFEGIIANCTRETLRAAFPAKSSSLESETENSRSPSAESMVETNELIDLSQGWIKELPEREGLAVQKKYTSLVVREYPRERNRALEHVDRSRGLKKLRQRASKLK